MRRATSFRLHPGKTTAVPPETRWCATGRAGRRLRHPPDRLGATPLAPRHVQAQGRPVAALLPASVGIPARAQAGVAGLDASVRVPLPVPPAGGNMTGGSTPDSAAAGRTAAGGSADGGTVARGKAACDKEAAGLAAGGSAAGGSADGGSADGGSAADDMEADRSAAGGTATGGTATGGTATGGAATADGSAAGGTKARRHGSRQLNGRRHGDRGHGGRRLGGPVTRRPAEVGCSRPTPSRPPVDSAIRSPLEGQDMDADDDGGRCAWLLLLLHGSNI